METEQEIRHREWRLYSATHEENERLRKALTDIAQGAPEGSWAQMTAAIALRTEGAS
jgi:hypothetical protein